MTLNFLGIAVGNTRTRIGAFVDGQLVDKRAFGNADLHLLVHEAAEGFNAIRHKESPRVVVSSVNPVVSEGLFSELARQFPVRLLRVEVDLPIPIGRHLDREALVGEDRLLNAAAAFDVMKQATVIIDAGTAMTVDFVDGAGTFHGGAIVPGAQLMLDSLRDRIPHLPEVEIVEPKEKIGHNTVEAMLVGVYFGIRGVVRELVEQFAEQAGSFPMVVATGGNAPMLFHNHDLVERIVPDLTLMGLSATLRTADQLDHGSES